MTNKLFLLLALFVSVFAASCDDLVDDIAFNVDGPTLNFTISEQDEPGTFTYAETNVPTNIATELADNNVDSDRLNSVKAEAATFRIVSTGADINFGLFDEIDVAVSSGNLSPIVFSAADLTNVTGTEATLDVRDDELLEFLRRETVDYTVTVKTNAAVPTPIDMRVDVTFRAKAAVL